MENLLWLIRENVTACVKRRSKGVGDFLKCGAPCALLAAMWGPLCPACQVGFHVVRYTPCFRIVGRTSDVTHRLNSFACGSLLDRIRLYKPDSLMMYISRFWPESAKRPVSLSSASTCFLSASDVSLYPSIVATSLPTNHGSLSMMIILTEPNSGSLCPWVFWIYPVSTKGRNWIHALVITFLLSAFGMRKLKGGWTGNGDGEIMVKQWLQ